MCACYLVVVSVSYPSYGMPSMYSDVHGRVLDSIHYGISEALGIVINKYVFFADLPTASIALIAGTRWEHDRGLPVGQSHTIESLNIDAAARL